MTGPILSVEDLHVRFRTRGATIYAVNGASFDVKQGEAVCLVGESGSGKSVTAMAVMGLLPRASAEIAAARLDFEGASLLGRSEHEMRKLRGQAIGMIFQDPMSSLNPAHTVGMQIIEGVRAHEAVSHAAARGRALDMLELVRIPDARRSLDSYPHELSGGMRQRVMIAMALVCQPRLLIADEPTTALDVTIQAQILTLIEDLRTELGLSLLLITHDLGVVADIADRVVVMYGGQVMETAEATPLFDAPAHPYSVGLMKAMPALAGDDARRLNEIPGAVPRLLAPPEGCTFAPRCPHAEPRCRTTPLTPRSAGPAHWTWCLRHGEIALGTPAGTMEPAE